MREQDSSGLISLLKRLPELDVDYAVRVIGGSEPLYINTLMQLIRMIPSNIDEMDKCLSADDGLRGFEVKAHGLKSALRNIGQIGLSGSAEALEKAAKSEDRASCEEHYGAFREALRSFHEQVTAAAAETAGADTAQGSGEADSDINDYIDTLEKAREAADFCDCIAASELMLPLAKLHFGTDINDLILKSATALDMFKPQEGFDYITELLGKLEDSSQ